MRKAVRRIVRRRAAAVLLVLALAGIALPSAVFTRTNGVPAARAAFTTLPCQNATGSQLKCLDLAADSVDPNGIPLDPYWGYQKPNVTPVQNVIDFCNPIFVSGGNVNPDCTSQQPVWEGPGNSWSNAVCGMGGGPTVGHSNWGVATYAGGYVYFEDHSSSWGGDDDYTMDLYTAGRGSLKGNKAGGYIHVEFDSDETIDHFATHWWQVLHEKVDNGNFDGHFVGANAIVTGLMGIDWVHTPGMESHPVYAFAAESSPGDWGFFVRDTGDEGYCSQHLQTVQFTGNTYTFKFPWQKYATAVSVSATIHDGLAGGIFGIPGANAVINPVKNDGVYLTLTFPSSTDGKPFYDGEIKFHWTAGKPGQINRGPCSTNPSLCQNKQEDDPERMFKGMIGPMLSTAQKTAIDKAVTPPAAKDVILPQSRITIRPLTRFPKRPLQKPTVRVVPDRAKTSSDALRRRMICVDIKGKAVLAKLRTACG